MNIDPETKIVSMNLTERTIARAFRRMVAEGYQPPRAASILMNTRRARLVENPSEFERYLLDLRPELIAPAPERIGVKPLPIVKSRPQQIKQYDPKEQKS